jgi:hypothetical protein
VWRARQQPPALPLARRALAPSATPAHLPRPPARPPRPCASCTAKLREEGAIEDLGWDSVGDDESYEELCNCK